MLFQFALHHYFRIDSGRQKSSRDRQTVFFTAVNPLATRCQEQKEVDLTKLRFAADKQQWKVHQNSVYWVDIRLAQRKGLKFFQTKWNAIILYDTLPPICIERLVSTKTQEVVYNKIYRSPRPVPTVTLSDNWQKDWNSDAAASSSSTQPTQSKRNQLASTVWPVTLKNRVGFDQENTSEHVRKDNVQCDQARTRRTVACDVGTLDFRNQGLLRNTVGKNEYVRVRELINRLENHPHRDELKADTRQDNVYNARIRRKWSSTLFMWSTSNYARPLQRYSALIVYLIGQKRIVYCTCGICLRRTEAMRRLNRKRIDFELRD